MAADELPASPRSRESFLFNYRLRCRPKECFKQASDSRQFGSNFRKRIHKATNPLKLLLGFNSSPGHHIQLSSFINHLPDFIFGPEEPSVPSDLPPPMTV
jgi:hypothetical protein